MASPKKNVAYEFDIALVDTADTGAFKVSPTIAAGDFKVSTDNGALVNLATLPVVSPAGSIIVKINLSAAEMNGDKILVQCIDAAGNEWDDVLLFIDATIVNVDDVVRATTPANTLDVSATGEAGLDLDNTKGTLAKGTDLTGFNDLSAAQVNTECDTAVAPVKTVTDLLPNGGALSDLATLITRVTVARMGALTDWIDGGRLDVLLDAIPTTAMRGTDSAALASVCTEVRLAELAAANLPTDVAAVDALVAALNDISNANVLTQVNAALDTAISELPVAIPTATPSVRTGLMLLYMMARNASKSTATERRILNDAAAIIAKATMSDDGTTFDQGELVSG